MSDLEGSGTSAPHLDPGRFDLLVEAAGPSSLLVLIRRSIGERLRASCTPEDIWQETLLHAWVDRHRHQWTGIKGYRAWLLAIARHRIHDSADRGGAEKRGGKVQTTEFSALAKSEDGGISHLLPAGSTTPSRLVSHHERATKMEQALAGLEPDHQDVVRLYLFEELPMEQVAEQLGVPTSTAWYRFRRGSELYARRLQTLSLDSPSP